MNETTEFSQRQRLAWMLLLAGFATFVLAAVTTPILVSAYLQNARRPLSIGVQANRGTVGINDLTEAVFAGDVPRPVTPGANLITSAGDTGLLSIFTADGGELLTRAQIYGNTTLEVRDATTPRFAVSRQASVVELVVINGRIRLAVPAGAEGRPTELAVATPHGFVDILSSGLYSVEVANAETRVSVQEGAVRVINGEGALDLTAAQRAVMALGGGVQGPLPSERNLVVNGGFVEGPNGLAGWRPLSWTVERSDQRAGEIQVIETGGTTALRVQRVGIGNAETSVRQVIDQDVTDFASLRLFVTMRIVNQSLEVCGTLGSECPLAVQIDYVDATGAIRTWRQGFYAFGEVNAQRPDVCQYCVPPLTIHEKVALGQVSFFESPNLLERLRQQGIEVRRISGVSLVVSGHSFDAEVLEISLIAQE